MEGGGCEEAAGGQVLLAAVRSSGGGVRTLLRAQQSQCCLSPVQLEQVDVVCLQPPKAAGHRRADLLGLQARRGGVRVGRDRSVPGNEVAAGVTLQQQQ